MCPALIPLRETLAAAARFGADAAGVADTARLASPPVSPPDLLSHYTRAVVLGIRLDYLSPAEPEARFRADCARLDEAALAMACWVQARGGMALPVPASLRPEHQGCGLISHKEAAAAAGLGWISPTGLLATHAFGPACGWSRCWPRWTWKPGALWRTAAATAAPAPGPARPGSSTSPVRSRPGCGASLAVSPAAATAPGPTCPTPRTLCWPPWPAGPAWPPAPWAAPPGSEQTPRTHP